MLFIACFEGLQPDTVECGKRRSELWLQEQESLLNCIISVGDKCKAVTPLLHVRNLRFPTDLGRQTETSVDATWTRVRV